MEQNEQRFEAYFKGQLSDDEVFKFNDQLASDQDFNASYQYFLSFKEATSSNMRDDLCRDQVCASSPCPTIL